MTAVQLSEKVPVTASSDGVIASSDGSTTAGQNNEKNGSEKNNDQSDTSGNGKISDEDSSNVRNGSDTDTMKLTGTTVSYQIINGTELASGRFIRTADVENHTNVAVINADTARDILGCYNTSQAIGQTAGDKRVFAEQICK